MTADPNFQNNRMTQRAEFLTLKQTDNELVWEKAAEFWTQYKADSRKNIFSTTGAGVNGGSFTVRRTSLFTLEGLIFFKGRYYFLTQLEAVSTGYLQIKTAEVTVVMCQSTKRCFGKNSYNRPVEVAGNTKVFPAAVLEKYSSFIKNEVSAGTLKQLCAITPKAIKLETGNLLELGLVKKDEVWIKDTAGVNGAVAGFYKATACHELNTGFNEYEIQREADV